MTAIMKTFTISMLLIIVLFTMANCTPAVSQEEYDSVTSELGNAKNQIATLQDKLAEAMIDEDLDAKYEELKKQYDQQIKETQTIKAEFDELNTEYEKMKVQYDDRNDEIQTAYDKLNNEFKELERQYNITVQGSADLSEEEIEQAIFELVNEERRNNNVDELTWGVKLYKQAEQNSHDMADYGAYQQPDTGVAWQEVFVAVRYGTLDQIATAALLIWKQNDYRYKYNIINSQLIYGTVATYKSGEVYYITYLASVFE